MAVALTLLVALGVTTASAAPASAATCVYDSGTRHLTVTLAADDIDLWVQASGPYLQTAGALCTLLAQVESVTLDVSANPTARVVFDLENGPLGPGYTNEGNGSSEIEFNVNGMGTQNAIVVHGGAGNDGLRVGQYTNKISGVTTGQLNLNSLVDGATQDVDVSFTDFPGSVRVYGHDGDDVIGAAGAGVLLSGAYGPSVLLDGGAGSNTVTGGNGNDLLYLHLEAMRTGVESVAGGPGSDDELIVSSTSADLSASITLDGVANDGVNCPGTQCDGDNVGQDIEQIVGSAASETIVANGGADYLSGNGGDDHLNGKGGADIISCDSGVASGAKGRDLIEPGEDKCLRVSGGSGFDQVSFDLYNYPVIVTLDNLANDGSSFNNLNVRTDVESIVGTPFGDFLVGNGHRNYLDGGYGRDDIKGNGGNDQLFGSFNADRLSGGAGDDYLDGGGGTDTCSQDAGAGTVVNCEQ
jgi:Ca2+-binding RTX toxin-like protein